MMDLVLPLVQCTATALVSMAVMVLDSSYLAEDPVQRLSVGWDVVLYQYIVLRLENNCTGTVPNFIPSTCTPTTNTGR